MVRRMGTLALMSAGTLIACVAGADVSEEKLRQLLGLPVDQLAGAGDFSIGEAPWVDEDESRVFTRSWKMTHREGTSFLVRTDDGIATMDRADRLGSHHGQGNSSRR